MNAYINNDYTKAAYIQKPKYVVCNKYNICIYTANSYIQAVAYIQDNKADLHIVDQKCI